MTETTETERRSRAYRAGYLLGTWVVIALEHRTDIAILGGLLGAIAALLCWWWLT